MLTLPKSPGSYALILAAHNRREINVGKLGALVVAPGFYVYVGSALGSGGAATRVGRNLREEKRHLLWNIDYLPTVT